ERRHVCADQLPLGWRQRGRATQDRLGNADPMRVDLGIGGENVLGRRIRGHRGKERHFATSSTRGSHCRSMRLHCRSTTRRGHRSGLVRRLGETDVGLVRCLPLLPAPRRYPCSTSLWAATEYSSLVPTMPAPSTKRFMLLK